MRETEVDLLVAGSGVGGLAAAVFGAKGGLRVLVVEKNSLLGGTTATSGGIAWIPCTDQARAAGVDDTPDRVRKYLRHELGAAYRADLIDAFLDSGATALRELEDGTEVCFDLINWPDYHPELPGGMMRGRSLLVRPWDARVLGTEFRRVRPPLARLMVLGGLMLGSEDLSSFLAPFASWKNFHTVVRKVLRYGVDRLRHPRGTELAAGNALVGRLFASLLQRGGEAWTDAPLRRLVTGDGRVTGAVIQRDGEEVLVRARHGVVLACGGFPHHAALLCTHGPAFPHAHSLATPGNNGDAIEAALAIGAALDTQLRSPALWSPGSALLHADGHLETIIYGYLDRGRPGVIAVRPDGRRFANESDSYHDIVMALFAVHRGVEPPEAWFVCDSAFLRKRGLGLIRPWPFTLRLSPYQRAGYLVSADDVRTLAARIGVDADGLADTVARHNDFARTGIDTDFHKGESSYNRLFGDAAVKPNPNLAPIIKAPFHAVRIHATSLGTTMGLKGDADARVLDAQDRPIAGLYACGNDLASIMRGAYPGGGVTLGPAIVFAWRAVRHLLAARP